MQIKRHCIVLNMRHALARGEFHNVLSLIAVVLACKWNLIARKAFPIYFESDLFPRVTL